MRRHAVEHAVMELLEWDLMMYCMFKYECGLKYLEVCMRGDADAVRKLEESVAFWGWWKLHWMIREQDFINAYENRSVFAAHNSLYGRRAVYQVIHNPVDLGLAMSEDGKALEDSYCRDLVRELR